MENETNVVDIGCSTGKLLESMHSQNLSIAPTTQYIGVEIEEDLAN